MLNSESQAPDITNRQLVSVQGEQIRVLVPPSILSKPAALVFAAWLVALADESPDHVAFRTILEKVEST